MLAFMYDQGKLAEAPASAGDNNESDGTTLQPETKKVREAGEEEEGLQHRRNMRASYTILKDKFMFGEATYKANCAAFEIKIDATTNTTKDNEQDQTMIMMTIC